MGYRRHYFSIRGRGEQIRLLCHACAIPFEDVRLSRSDFAALRAEGPSRLAFGSLPMLEDDGFYLVQGPAGTRHGARPSDVRDAARCAAPAGVLRELRVRAAGLRVPGDPSTGLSALTR